MATAMTVEVSVVDLMEFGLMLTAITNIVKKAQAGEAIQPDDPAITELVFASKTFSRALDSKET